MKKLQSINESLFQTLELDELKKVFGGDNSRLSAASMPDYTITSKNGQNVSDGIDSSDDV